MAVLPPLLVLASVFAQAPGGTPPSRPAASAADPGAPAINGPPPARPGPPLDAPVALPAVELAPPPMLAPSPPARPPFRRTATGMSLAIASGWAVALPSTALMTAFAPDPQFPHVGAAVLDIGLVMTALTASCLAPVVTSSAIDGRTDSPIASSIGLGTGAVVGFGVAEVVLEGAPGLSPKAGYYVLMAAIPLWATIGYYWVQDADAARMGASTREKRKLSLALLFGGNTILGNGVEAAFNASDRLGLALQVISGQIGGAEGSLRLEFFALALPRSGIYLAAGPHLTTGAAPNSAPIALEKPAAAAGALAAAGWQFRGEHGFVFQVEASVAYEPAARNVREAGGGRIFPGGALMLGYAR